MRTRSPDNAAGAGPASYPGAWVQTRLRVFNRTKLLEMLGPLAIGAASAGFKRQFLDQTTAWQIELEIVEHAVQEVLRQIPTGGDLMLPVEYTIPRRQRCIDTVLLSPRMIGAMEFKSGATAFERTDRWQVEDYALDLQDFHGGSRAHVLVPFLMATGTGSAPVAAPSPAGFVRLVGRTGLAEAILLAFASLWRWR